MTTFNAEYAITLFRKATSRTVCRSSSCDACQDIYGNECPIDEKVDEKEVVDFVRYVLQRLSAYKENNISSVTEDELMDIFMEAVDGR